MFKTVYRVTVRVGAYEFNRDFANEGAALTCFNALGLDAENVAIEGDKCTLESTTQAENVTIQRFAVPIRIGDPNR